jgi:cellulose synthase/poly-beta-1,6-N-acetylglucosamine synthase-like glycosyltransferase
MTIWLQLSLAAFALALVHAFLLNDWVRRIMERTGPEKDEVLPPTPPITVSVIVPVRNGADTIVALLQDLNAQRYPKSHCEVLVVDDHSEDGTAQRVQGLMRNWPQLQLLSSSGVGKKAAITSGVEAATGELVLITDADVRCGPDRVPVLAAHWAASRPAMVLMPVRMDGEPSALHRLQRTEHHALQGATIGSGLMGRPVLANGANMAFARVAFDRIGGFGPSRWASGDDLFLLRRIQRARWPVSYLADGRTMVTTLPEDSWRGFLAQRLRWAGKMWALIGARGTWTGIFALLIPWALAVLTVLVMRNVHVGQKLFHTVVLLAAAWALWAWPVLRLVHATARYLDPAEGPPGLRTRLFTAMAVAAFLLYAPVIGLLSSFVRPRWKGRRARLSRSYAPVRDL